MNKNIFYTLGFFLLLCLIFMNKEGFVNTYEPNKVLSDEPDDIQYYACRQDKTTSNPEYPFQKYRRMQRSADSRGLPKSN